jgi:hypothetical protein
MRGQPQAGRVTIWGGEFHALSAMYLIGRDMEIATVQTQGMGVASDVCI